MNRKKRKERKEEGKCCVEIKEGYYKEKEGKNRRDNQWKT